MYGDLMPDDHFGPGVSFLFVYGVMLALPGLLILVQSLFALWHRRRGEQSDASYEDKAFYAAGEAVLFGEVEYAEGATAAVRTVIQQTGTETKGKNGWNHTWKEVDRSVEVEPFYLVTPSAKRVRIEPDHEVMHVDAMDTTEQRDKVNRVRTATLTPGEAIYAVGDLVEAHDPQGGADYRGGSKTLVLRPPARGKMLLSSEALGDRFRRRASHHVGFSVAVAALTILFQLIGFPYHLRMAAAERATGHVVHTRHFVTKSKNGSTDHWEVTIETEDGVRFEDEVSRSHWYQLEVKDEVPILVVPWWEGRERVGHHVTVALALPMTFLLFFALLFGAYVLSIRSSRPWYEGKLDESGSGRLPDPNASP